ncbi:MAG TPA: ATP-binding protein [Bryobacteraceae bacterium]|nr:ATP-binding protein [Bryobacteraceae bacterium]
MSLRTRLRIAIVALVTLVVIAMSLLYLYDFTSLSFRSAFDRADVVADEVNGNITSRLSAAPPDPAAPASVDQLKQHWTTLIRNDPDIARMLVRMLANAKLVSSIRVADDRGNVLAASDPGLAGTKLRPTRSFKDIQSRHWIENLLALMTQSEDYSTSRTLGVNNQTFFQIVVAIKSDFVRHDVEPALNNLALAFGASLLIAIFLGFVVPNIVLDPLGRMSRTIDSILSGQAAPELTARQWEAREFAAVQSKLSVLGEQFRGAKQDALELRSNVEQLLQRLEEAVLLFDNSGRLLLAGAPAERLLGATQADMIGRKLEDLFPLSSALGSAIAAAVQNRHTVRDQMVAIQRDSGPPQKLLVSVQVLQRRPGEDQIGTLVEVRDVESRRQLERHLDLSSRLAALSRLTSGVAHEIKNPLNAMAVQLELLKSKLTEAQPEVEVIGREIKRLDNVVKTFLNFNRPIEVAAKILDLGQLVSQIVDLVAPEAAVKGIRIEADLKPGIQITGDSDLLQQAILNVINNGLEAMPRGGTLSVRILRDGADCQLQISDSGCGIAPEYRDRIFNLYFTTKEKGSGIGLATTFRVVQLHGGTIDFASEPGKGTTFRLRFPGMVDYRSEVFHSASNVS